MTTTEQDPHGFSQHAPGAKLDSGKLRAGLVLGGFSRALKEVVKVGTFGANKYSDNGWKQVPNAQGRYLDALHRHLLEAEITELDDDSGLSHLAHAAWNILAVLEFRMAQPEYDPQDVAFPAGAGSLVTQEEREMLLGSSLPPFVPQGTIVTRVHDMGEPTEEFGEACGLDGREAKPFAHISRTGAGDLPVVDIGMQPYAGDS